MLGVSLAGFVAAGATSSGVLARDSASVSSASRQRIGKVAVKTYLTVSASRGLKPHTVGVLRRMADQAGLSSTIVHQGTIDLKTVYRTSNVVRSVPDGAGIPMSVLAVDPVAIGPTTSSNVAGATESGHVVVGASAAGLHSIRGGDDLQLLNWSGAPVRVNVSDVVPDSTIGGAELMMSLSTASMLGLDRPFSLRVWGFANDRAVSAFAKNVTNVAAGQALRVLSSGRAPTLDDSIAQTQLKDLLGVFWIKRGRVGALQVDPAWKFANVAVVKLPIVGDVTCNTKVAKAAADALAELRDNGLSSLVHGADSRRFGGCFSARVTRSLSGNSGHNLSRHTWGAAIDLNPSENPYGGKSKMDPRVIDAFHHHGFAWGGTFIVPDPMHFEYTGR